MAHNPRLGFHPSLAARAAAARAAAKAAPTTAPAAVVREETKELRLCGLAAVQARFARDPASIQRLFYEAAMGQRVGAICKVLAGAKKIYRQVESAELEKVAGSLHHGGVVAVVTPPALRVPTAADVREWARRGEAVLVLDRIGNAHNLGAIARTAAFFGVARIVIPDHPNAAKPTEAAHRVAEGGLEVVEVWQTRDLVGRDVDGAALVAGRVREEGFGDGGDEVHDRRADADEIEGGQGRTERRAWTCGDELSGKGAGAKPGERGRGGVSRRR